MADWLTCSNKDIDALSLFMMLQTGVTQLDGTICTGIKIVEASTKSNCALPACSTKEEFMELFKQVIDVPECSSEAWIRVYISPVETDRDIQGVYDCGANKSIWEILRQCFVNTTDGVAIHLVQMTCAEQ